MHKSIKQTWFHQSKNLTNGTLSHPYDTLSQWHYLPIHILRTSFAYVLLLLEDICRRISKIILEMISIIIYIKATMISNKSHAHTFYGNVVNSSILAWNEFWIVWLFNSYALLFENLESFKLFSLQILGSWEHPQIFWSQCTRYRKYRKYASWKEMWFD